MQTSETQTGQIEKLRAWVEAGHEQLAAQITPETINAEDRTVDIVWFTGIDVPRNTWQDGPHTLRFDPKGVDLKLLNNGAPILDNHWMMTTADQMGRVVRAWEDDGVYKATIRFSRHPDLDRLWGDIADKIVTKFSMGVELLESVEKRDGDDKLILKTVTKWRPYEISVAPIPADFNTTTLQAEPQRKAALTEAPTSEQPGATARKEELSMDTQNPGTAEAPVTQPTAVVTQPAPAVTVEQLAADAVRKERERMTYINDRGARLGLSKEFVDQLINDGTSIEKSALAMTDEAAKADRRVETRSHVTVTVDESDTRREGMANAILNRYQPDTYKLEKGRGYAGYSLLELARQCVEAKGKNTRGLSRTDVAMLGLHTTSDFPGILENVLRKVLRQSYDVAAQTFKPLARRMTLTDFKAANLLLLGNLPTLEPVNEAGEFTYGTLTESKSTIQLKTYGRIIGITRQVLVNDDIDAFTTIPARWGNSVANKESDVVWGLITANANMADGVPVFHATHANLGGAAAIDVNSVGEARAAMAKQKDIDKKTVLNIRPKYLIVPAALETKAEQFVAANIIATQLSNAIPASLRSLTPIAEPRLDANSATAWYVFADPNQVDTLVYAYLEGQEGPDTRMEEGFEIDGVKFRCRLDFGAAVGDYRGMYKNPGA